MVLNHVWAWGMWSPCEEFCFIKIKIRNWWLLLSSLPKYSSWISCPLCHTLFSYRLISAEILCFRPISISLRLKYSTTESSYHPSQFPPACILCKENKCTLLPRNGLCNSIYGSANYHFQILRISFLFTTLSLWEVDSFFDSDIKELKSTSKRCWKVRWADQAYNFCHILSFSLPSVWEFETWIWSSQIAVQYMAMTSSEDLFNRELLFLHKDNPYHKKTVSFSMQTLELNFKDYWSRYHVKQVYSETCRNVQVTLKGYTLNDRPSTWAGSGTQSQ